jgi:hypothetical protein
MFGPRVTGPRTAAMLSRKVTGDWWLMKPTQPKVGRLVYISERLTGKIKITAGIPHIQRQNRKNLRKQLA